MYICPTCNKGFKNAKDVTKHSLKCWHKYNPKHESKSAPCKGNVTERQMNEDVNNFFMRFKTCQK